MESVQISFSLTSVDDNLKRRLDNPQINLPTNEQPAIGNRQIENRKIDNQQINKRHIDNLPFINRKMSQLQNKKPKHTI